MLLLRSYSGKREEWEKYAMYRPCDSDTKYKRYLLTAGDGYSILLLVWPIGAIAPNHGHKGCECWVRILSGELIECIERLNYCENLILKRDNITYINDKIGRHSMSNKGTELTISLHVYSSFEMSGLEEGRIDFNFSNEFD